VSLIELIPLGTSARQLDLETLQKGIGKILPVDVRVSDLHFDMDNALDHSRKQYHSTQIIATIIEKAQPGNSKLLGVTSYDLFIPVLTFVFGQAQLNNRVGVFSTFRLRNEFYGLRGSDALMRQRTLKEALHELGHTYGLRHCMDHPCVMNSSTYVEDIDLKPGHFCMHCIEHIHSVI
jgi:archaemetzincin